MAAPHVAGGLAALKSMFPNLSYQDVRDRMLCTANDTGVYQPEGGAPGSAVGGCTGKQVGEIYGHGLLDLDAASRPVGGTSFALSASDHGPITSTDGAQITLPDAVVTNALDGRTVLVLDNFQRAPFEVPVETFTRRRTSYLSVGDLPLDPPQSIRAVRSDGTRSLTVTGDDYGANGVFDGDWFVGGGGGGGVTEALARLTGAPGAHGRYRMNSDAAGIALGVNMHGGALYATAATNAEGTNAGAGTGFGVSSWAPSSVVGGTWVPEDGRSAFGVSFASNLDRAGGFAGAGAFSVDADSVDIAFGRRLMDGRAVAVDVSARLAHIRPAGAAMVQLDDTLVASAKLDLTAALDPRWTLSAGVGFERGLGAGAAQLRIADTIDEEGRIGFDEVRIDQGELVRFDMGSVTAHYAARSGVRYAAGVKALRDGFGDADAVVGLRAAMSW